MVEIASNGWGRNFHVLECVETSTHSQRWHYNVRFTLKLRRLQNAKLPSKLPTSIRPSHFKCVMCLASVWDVGKRSYRRREKSFKFQSWSKLDANQALWIEVLKTSWHRRGFVICLSMDRDRTFCTRQPRWTSDASLADVAKNHWNYRDRRNRHLIINRCRSIVTPSAHLTGRPTNNLGLGCWLYDDSFDHAMQYV